MLNRRGTTRTLITLGLVAVLGLPAQPASAAANDYFLGSGEFLTIGQKLVNGPYRLVLQNGGNLVQYWNTPASTADDALWASGTSDTPGASPITKLLMRTSGRLSILRADGTEAWARGPFPDDYGLTMSNNGDVKIGAALLYRKPGGGWHAGAGDSVYTNRRPDSNYMSYCYDANVPQRIRDGYTISLSHSLPMTNLYSGLESTCDEYTDLRVSYAPISAHALTGCNPGKLTAENICTAGQTTFNSNEIFDNYSVLSCHELGHLMSIKDYKADYSDGAGSNSDVLEDDWSCMRNLPYYVRYSTRQIQKINESVP